MSTNSLFPVYRKTVSNEPVWMKWVHIGLFLVIYTLMAIFLPASDAVLYIPLIIIFLGAVDFLLGKLVFKQRSVKSPILQVQDDRIVFKYPEDYENIILDIDGLEKVSTNAELGYFGFSDSAEEKWMMEYHLGPEYFTVVREYLKKNLPAGIRFTETS